MYQYAYLVGVAVLAVFWVAIFLKRKDLRMEQLLMSFLAAPFAPLLQVLWFYNDYWRPQYFYTFYVNGIPVGIEEALFLFFAAGIASVSYEFLLGRTHRRGKKNNYLLIIGIISCLAVIVSLKMFFELNIIWASIIGLATISVGLLMLNNKLELDFIYSGLIMMSVALIWYAFLFLVYPELPNSFWVEENLSGIALFKIPIEEFLWFLSWGLFSGIMYEAWINVKSYPVLSRTRN